MNLGLVCLADMVKALGEQCGADLREDTKEGTAVWFQLPLLSGSVTRNNFSNDPSAVNHSILSISIISDSGTNTVRSMKEISLTFTPPVQFVKAKCLSMKPYFLISPSLWLTTASLYVKW